MENFDDQVWKVITELGSFERHFNQLEHQYRVIASTWLLAMFAGVGFVISRNSIPFPRELIVCFLGFASAMGVTLIWALDLKVYHQLLEAYFVEALKLERMHPWLPQSRSNMWRAFCPAEKGPRRPLGILECVRWFYVIGNTVCLAIAASACSLYLHQKKPDSALPFLVAGMWLLIIIVWDVRIYRATRSPLLEQMANDEMQRAR